MADNDFERVEEQNSDRCGPEALLICGFEPSIAATLNGLLAQISAPDHRLVFCSSAMVRQELGQALEPRTDGREDPPAAPGELPQVIVLAGMTGEQLRSFVGNYVTTGLPRPIFATTTPINLKYPVGRLLVDLLQEHRAMAQQ